MDFAFTDEQEHFASELARYARQRLAPEYARWDRGEPFPKEERLTELAELGVTGLRVPEQYGGMPASYVTLGIAAEELARAVRKDGTWVLSGEKASITFAGYADACVVFARTGGEGARGVSAFLVPLHRPGVERSVYPSMGEKLSQRGSLFFDAVEVPDDHMLGAGGGGFVQAMQSFDYNRAIIGLAFVGTGRQSIDEVIEYTKTRQAFGKPLAGHEGVSFQVAEHLAALDAARLISYRALWKRDRNEPHASEAAMAKLLAGRAGVAALHACLLLHGHYGYSTEAPFDQRLRDLIGLEIGDGTPEIMKGIIAREAYGPGVSIYK